MVKKPKGYIRMCPYSIWTKRGEDPVYDVTVEGRPPELIMNEDRTSVKTTDRLRAFSQALNGQNV